jgi:inosine triphosphate pyrophosphatase
VPFAVHFIWLDKMRLGTAIAAMLGAGLRLPAGPPSGRCPPLRACQPSLPADADSCSLDERCIFFVTGNAKKELEVNTILKAENLSPFRVSHIDLDLPEYQGDPLYIARHKCIEASKRVGSSVLVEDTSLCFSALNGLPGPYIKWFVDRLGNDGLYSLLHGHEDKTAYCQCVLAFSPGPGAEPVLFVGKTHGRIVEPTGSARGGFGWDAIFIPDGMSEPFGAMGLDEKNRISHRARALSQFVQHCKANQVELVGQISMTSSSADVAP